MQNNTKTTIKEQFPIGIKATKPADNAPAWIISKLYIERDELIDWLRTQPATVKLDVKMSMKKTHFIKVNHYNPNE